MYNVSPTRSVEEGKREIGDPVLEQTMYNIEMHRQYTHGMGVVYFLIKRHKWDSARMVMPAQCTGSGTCMAVSGQLRAHEDV
jgi:hypothetical protein